jgi:hypothetical protein
MAEEDEALELEPSVFLHTALSSSRHVLKCFFFLR